MAVQVGIYVYDEVEVLDFAGPFEVFSTASRVAGRLSPGTPAPFHVALVAEARRTVVARAGFRVEPHFSIDDHPPIDVLVVPGGVHDREMAKERVVEWIARRYASARLTASVCTGAFLLARAGILDGLEATTHWEDCADLAAQFPKVRVREGARFVEEGRIATSAGISAGLDLSLRIVAKIAGDELARRTARQMDYDWRQG